jgi:NADPH:quinone reductase-like Zn-dependent oxidoreductase
MRAATIVERRIVTMEHQDPVPGDGEILVAVRASGLNNADVAARFLATVADPPTIPGLEIAGTVQALGPGCTRFAVGDAVMAVTGGGGGHAELAVVGEGAAMAVPQGIDWPQAGGFMEVFATAHDALFTACRLTVGERLLVTGAAGGVGIAAVQLGVAAGAEVVASVRDPDRWEAVAAFGAQVVEPETAENRGPYDVVLEMFPSANVAADIRSLRTGGRIHVVSTMGGGVAEVDFQTLMGRRGSIHSAGLKSRPAAEIAEVVTRLERHAAPLLATGALRVPVLATYPLTAAVDAYKRFAAGGKLGKIVLVTDTASLDS